jgi:hypothetical protein
MLSLAYFSYFIQLRPHARFDTPQNRHLKPPFANQMEEGDQDQEHEIEAIVVEKSRDGIAYFEAFRGLRVGIEEKKWSMRRALWEHINQTSDEETSAILLTYNQKSIDRMGLNYFAQLNEHWDTISRANQKLASETYPIPPDPDANNFAFTQLFDNPFELDLRARPWKKPKKRHRGNVRAIRNENISDQLSMHHQGDGDVKKLSKGGRQSLHDKSTTNKRKAPSLHLMAFTQVFDDPFELDLRARPWEQPEKILPKGKFVPMKSFNHNDESVWGHFKKFVRAHDTNLYQLKELSEGPSLPSHSPA